MPLAAAETVIAISGRVPAIESRTMPPIASPSLKRLSRASVVLARLMPATQVAADPAAKIRKRAGTARRGYSMGERSARCKRSARLFSSRIAMPP